MKHEDVPDGFVVVPAGPAEANPITRFLLPAIGSKSYAKILLIYLWCLGGLIGSSDACEMCSSFCLTSFALRMGTPTSVVLY